MNLEDAANNFARSMGYCDDLVQVHRGHGGTGKGRRAEETALNRAIVVLTIAAWQAVAQDLTTAAVDVGRTRVADPLTLPAYDVIAGRVRKDIGDFSTPNAENTRRLMLGVGFDPRPHWTWFETRVGRGRVRIEPSDVDTTLNLWLRLRHEIAHGHSELSPLEVLEAVRRKEKRGRPSVNLADAEACIRFVRRLTAATGDALANHLGLGAPAWSLQPVKRRKRSKNRRGDNSAIDQSTS